MTNITLHMLSGDLLYIENTQNTQHIKNEIKSYLQTSIYHDEWIHLYDFEFLEIKEEEIPLDLHDVYVLILPTTFLPWIDSHQSEIAWYYLCKNPNPKKMLYIEESIKNGKLNDKNEEISNLFFYLSPLPEAIHLIKQYPQYIKWNLLSSNPHPEAVELLLSNPEKIDWDQFSKNSNPTAVAYLSNYPNRIRWSNLCALNKCPDIVPLMEKYLDCVNWDLIGNSNKECPEIVDFMIKHADKINIYYTFSSISNDKIVRYLIDHPEHINWTQLSYNHTDLAIEMLKKNKDKICWNVLAQNSHPEAIKMIGDNLSNIVGWKMLLVNPGKDIIPLLMEHYEDIKKDGWHKNAHLSIIYKNEHAIPLLKKVMEDKEINLDKKSIDFEMLWANPGIFC